jgi:hypothetical protein
VFRRVFANDARVTLHACAVGEHTGTVLMHDDWWCVPVIADRRTGVDRACRSTGSA